MGCCSLAIYRLPTLLWAGIALRPISSAVDQQQHNIFIPFQLPIFKYLPSVVYLAAWIINHVSASILKASHMVREVLYRQQDAAVSQDLGLHVQWTPLWPSLFICPRI